MEKINMGNVSKLASVIYRAWIEKHPEDKNNATWYSALREAYKELRIASIMPETLESFMLLSGQEQHDIIYHKATLVPVLVMREYHINEQGEKVYHGIDRIKWMLRKKDGGNALESWHDSIEMIVNQAYIYIMEKWEQYQGKISFSEFMLKCVKNAAFKIGRSLQDKPSRNSQNFPSLDNEKFALAISFNSQYYYPNTAEQAIAESYVYSLANDKTDETIIKGKLYGLTQTELAKALDVSQVAISKRLKKMHERLNADKLAK